MTDVLSSQNQWPRSTMTGVPTQQSNHHKNTRRTVPKFKNDVSPRTASRKVTLFRNGDRYFAGKQIDITPQNYANLGQLLQELSTTIDLPYGVRRLFTPNRGSEVTDVNIIKDGAAYVCASFEPFQKLEYTAITVPRVTFNIEQCKSYIFFSFVKLDFLRQKKERNVSFFAIDFVSHLRIMIVISIKVYFLFL